MQCLRTSSAAVYADAEANVPAIPGDWCVRAIRFNKDKPPCTVLWRRGRRVGASILLEVQGAIVTVTLADKFPARRWHEGVKINLRRKRRRELPEARAELVFSKGRRPRKNGPGCNYCKQGEGREQRDKYRMTAQGCIQ